MDERAEFIKGLRALAEFYEARPTFPMCRPVFDIWPTVQDTQGVVHLMMDAGAKKVTFGNYFVLRLQFGPVTLDVDWEYKRAECAAEFIYNNSLDKVGAGE